MNTYIFLIDKNNECETVYNAISADRIETLRASGTYDRNGQKVGTDLTGDSVELHTEKAVQVAQRIADEQGAEYIFEIGDLINGYDNSDIYDEAEEALTAECEEGEDFTLTFTEYKGFNYSDGSNWKSIITDAAEYDADWEILDDEQLEKELNEAIENAELTEEDFGKKIYETDKYEVLENFFYGAWESYQVNEK